MALNPHYLDTTPGQDRQMVLFVLAMAALILCALGYVVMTFTASGAGAISIVLAVLLGYYLADFFSGLVHWSLDTWFDEKRLGRAVAVAREHHTHPQNIFGYRFLDHAALGAIPGAAVFWPLFLICLALPVSVWTHSAVIAIAVICLCLLFGTSFHNFGHIRGRGLLGLAQKLRLVMTPAYHAVHHGGDHTVRYCTVNGWANPLCDRFGVWRGLEWLIARVTGAVPRADDVDWERHFRATGTLKPLQPKM